MSTLSEVNGHTVLEAGPKTNRLNRIVSGIYSRRPAVPAKIKSASNELARRVRRDAIFAGRVVALPFAVVGVVAFGMGQGAFGYLARVTDIGWELVKHEADDLGLDLTLSPPVSETTDG